ncbi:23S rRNA (guanosine(2251)-2'-O)-methyltransferase RlmB [Marinigracilibium pacificum]|uniref:23S rRNA (Guanosine(2251)-2'-O)-methyltransferase RlmB n=1 Tax=Marinigracilibium pacificum TaxID=2729599 RepID=A0A848J6V3_9BACT|nr:23S rRNA (guanosine(2251)-2'-O)-methyltransferase RlmB [Marinigracilibium pacificum]NMM48842.1 23S rRNA (guanosine(2251)-2'-O)-methyltransferase RlmB [Marinigracilibium pacificum]
MRTGPNKEDYIFGTRAVIESIEAGREIEKLLLLKNERNALMQELVGLARAHEIPVQYVPQEKLNRITRKNHQGAIAFISPVKYLPMAEVVTSLYEEGKNPFIMILDRVTDVRNFGAIARTCECMGVDAIVVPSRGSAMITGDAVKTSAGALNHIKVCREDNLKESINFLQDYGVTVVACTEKADKNINQVDLSGPVAILMGSEEDGISPEYLKRANASAKIPMTGNISSLNVSVAAGMAAYEVTRQRLTHK